MNIPFDISKLLAKSVQENLNADEQNTLNAWINQSVEHKEIFERLHSDDYLLEQLKTYQQFDPQKGWKKLEDELFDSKVVSIGWWRYAAAILFPILLVGASLYYFNKTEQITLSQIDTVIHPGVEKATLILADGSSMALSDADNFENTIQQGQTKLSNQNTSLIYEAESKEENGPTIWNELITPKGGKYELILADGTHVWLNAESSLKYPVNFSDSVRNVLVTGEAFFEVTHTGKPFVVNNNQMNIRVLGTSFNVNTYEKSAVAVTLVEGKVKVQAGGQQGIMTPSQQAILDAIGLHMEAVNTDIYTSWINNKIEFENERLEDVMIRLSRWYDFEYRFENQQAKEAHFTARIDSDLEISSVLEMLELTTAVHFELDQSIIVIK